MIGQRCCLNNSIVGCKTDAPLSRGTKVGAWRGSSFLMVLKYSACREIHAIMVSNLLDASNFRWPEKLCCHSQLPCKLIIMLYTMDQKILFGIRLTNFLSPKWMPAAPLAGLKKNTRYSDLANPSQCLELWILWYSWGKKCFCQNSSFLSEPRAPLEYHPRWPTLSHARTCKDFYGKSFGVHKKSR